MTYDEVVREFPIGTMVRVRGSNRCWDVMGHRNVSGGPQLMEAPGEWWALWQIEKVEE